MDTVEEREEYRRMEEEALLARESPEMRHRRARVMLYPVKVLTQKELEKLPKGETITKDFLEQAAIGTLFLCRSSNLPQGIVVVGEIIKVDDIPPPNRTIKRYRAVVS